MDLNKLRGRLSDIDRRIIDLVAERQSVVEEIGTLKLAEGRATRDYQREKKVLDAARAQAEALGIPSDLAAAMMQLLIQSSLTRQERARVRAEGRGRLLVCQQRFGGFVGNIRLEFEQHHVLNGGHG